MDALLEQWLGEVGQLADITRLLSIPTAPRRGWAQDVAAPSPAAGAPFTRPVASDAWERLVAVTFKLVTSAVVANRVPRLQLLNGDGVVLRESVLAAPVPASTTVTCFGDVGGPTGQLTPGLPLTEAVGGFVAAGNGAATLPAGASLHSFTVTWGNVAAANATIVSVVGAVGGTIAYGVQLAVGQNTAFTPPIPDPLPPANPAVGIQVTVTGNANSPAGEIETFGIASVSGLKSHSPIFDDVVKSGWQFQLGVDAMDAGDQLSGIALLVERYPSSVAAGVVP